jgi:hypothetical protein
MELQLPNNLSFDGYSGLCFWDMSLLVATKRHSVKGGHLTAHGAVIVEGGKPWIWIIDPCNKGGLLSSSSGSEAVNSCDSSGQNKSKLESQRLRICECDESNLITGIHFVSRWRLSMSSRPLRP